MFREGITTWKKRNESFRENLRVDSLEKYARELGVTTDSLDRLEIGFDTYCYTFPMRSADGEIVGIRTRPLKGGKLTMPGGRLGLFIPGGVTPGNLQIINEGESDVAVALSAGFAAIGVPSAGAAVEDVVEFVSQNLVACPCIIGDNDAVGTSGADKLADALRDANIPCRVLIPPDPYADLRDWMNKGNLAPKAFADAITSQKIVYPDGWPSYFFMVPNALIRRGLISQVGPAAYAVLAAIASFSDSKGICRVARDELSELTGLDVRTIDRYKGILKNAGLLSWKPGYTERVNEYRVNVGPCKGSKRKYSVHPVVCEKK